MRRDTKAFLIDVVEAADAILAAVNGISKVDNTLVWGVIQSYLKPLRAACIALAAESGRGALCPYCNRSRFFVPLITRIYRLGYHLLIDEWLHLFHKCRVIRIRRIDKVVKTCVPRKHNRLSV